MPEGRIYAGLDIGTTKITAIGAEWDEERDGIRIIGIGTAPSDGNDRSLSLDRPRRTRSPSSCTCRFPPTGSSMVTSLIIAEPRAP